MIAPAPTRSSTAGLSDPSGQRSPAAITAIRLPKVWAAAATADALRRQPAITLAPSRSASSDTVAPLGDGSTTRVPAGSVENEAGESEYGACGEVAVRGTASAAPIVSARALARWSFQRA